MNKFSRLFLGLKALLGQKAPSSAVTDTSAQLDWDNHKIALEDGEWWMAEIAKATPVNHCLGKVAFIPETDPFKTCTVCNNDKLVVSSEVENPFICGWCNAEDAYIRKLIKAEEEADKQTKAMLLKELTSNRLSDAVDMMAKGNAQMSDLVDYVTK